MNKPTLAFLGALLLGGTALAATAANAPAPLNWTAEQDRQNMMDQLGITRLRPGANGNPLGAGHANYDEDRSLPWGDVPALMTFRNGQPVTTPAQWQQRRAEIREDFDREVLGRVPKNVPKVTWKIQGVDHEMINRMPVTATQLVGHVDNAAAPSIKVDIKMTLVLPANAKGPVPVLMMFGTSAYPNPAQPRADFEKINAAMKAAMVKADPSLAKVFKDYPGWQPFTPPSPFGAAPRPAAAGDPPSQEQLIADGWGFVSFDPGSVQADNGAGLTKGIVGLVNKGQARKPDDWGALRAWAWGAGQGLDYLRTVKEVDSSHVGIEGVSRYGKAALVTMAYDERFAMVLVGSSGEGGAKLYRHDLGEKVENLTAVNEFHWMAGNFLKYGTEESKFGRMDAGNLPVDAHELIALCAPRLTFISYGIPGVPIPSGDALWQDQNGSYMAIVAAQPAFRLLGATALGISDDWRAEKKPAVNAGLLDGKLAWRQHDGGHTDAPNMKYFIAWADKFMGRKAPLQTASN